MSTNTMELFSKKIGPFSDHFLGYIKLVKDGNIRDVVKEQGNISTNFFRSIPKEKLDYRYAEGKWSVKEVLQHITDAERVFAYRALAFARKDSNALPSFDENKYAENSHAELRSQESLIEEFDTVRRSTVFLFNSFTDEDLASTGVASGSETSVMALGYIIAGHAQHHINLIKERYL